MRLCVRSRTFSLRLFLASFLLMLALSAGSALAAVNVVPVTSAGESSRIIVPNDLKPAECAGIAIDALVVIGGSWASGSRELVLGTPNIDYIKAKQGSDCILGGGGADELDGQGGDDVILGGPGNDHIDGGNGYDICYGNGGSDTFSKCEEIYP